MSAQAIPTRKAARYPFAAEITIHEPTTGTRTSGRTTDLSIGGCGVRVGEVFSRGVRLDVEIRRDRESMSLSATVAYGLPPNVMGLSFGELSAENAAVLARWIEQAIPAFRRTGADREIPLPDPQPAPATAGAKKFDR